MQKYLFLAALLFSSVSDAGDFDHRDAWLSLIRQRLGSSCPVAFVGDRGLKYGADGSYRGEVTVNTCAGQKVYLVEYDPLGSSGSEPSHRATEKSKNATAGKPKRRMP